MLKRPSKDDTEEDLLRFQEEFLAAKSSPAVSVLKKCEKRTSSDSQSHSPSSILKKDVVNLDGHPVKSHPEKKKIKFEDPKIAADLEDAEERLERHDQHITKILSKVVEKEFKTPHVYFPDSAAFGGFPRALHRGSIADDEENSEKGHGKKKRSLFSKQFLKQKDDFGVKFREPRGQALGEVTERTFGDVEKKTDLFEYSHLITGSGLNAQNSVDEMNNIHQENVQTLSAMSEEDILGEQARLLSSLDPGLIDFIKSRKSRQSNEPKNEKTPNTASVAMETECLEQPTSNNITESFENKNKDLPIVPKKEWVNMDKIEYEKLEWMKTIKPPKADDSSTGQSARFDFQGHLLAADADVPMHLGLHHHGSEPEKAGYTLEEIFLLSRSANMQQRVTALNILAHIITNARHGEFSECTSLPIIPTLLDGGLLFINRWALDDSADNTMTAAVNLMHKILVVEEDEEALDATFYFYHGHIVPKFCSLVTDEEEVDENGEKIQKTDADVVKTDLILGLLRMSLLPRLRYILDKWHPAPSVVIQVIQIMIRMARHSTQVAYEITQCPGLIEMLFKEFLPNHWKPVEDQSTLLSTIYGYPAPEVMKLVRILCASSRNIAANLIKRFGLISLITRYLCDDNLQLNTVKAASLVKESYRTWQTCCCYGLGLESYESLYPVLVEKVQHLSKSQLYSDCSMDDCQLHICVTSLLECILQVAASVTFEASEQAMNEAKSLSSGDSVSSRFIPAIQWSQVNGFSETFITFMKKELMGFTNKYFEKQFDLQRTSTLCYFVGSYITLAESQPGYNTVEMVQLLENLCDTCLVPCLKSNSFLLVSRYLREYSVLLLDSTASRKEVTPNLPEVGSLYGNKAEQCPVLQTKSTVNFIVCFTRLLISVCKLHKGLVSKLLPLVVNNDEILQYVRKICLWQKKAPLASNHFAKFENQVQFNLLTMCRMVLIAKIDLIDAKLYHHLALYLLIHLHQGDEYMAHSLLSTLLFNQDFIADVSPDGLSTFNEVLQLEEEKYLQSATSENVKKPQSDLIADACSHLVSVRNSYLQAVSSLFSSLQKSRNCSLPKPLDIDNLQSGVCGQLLVPVDWPFFPLIHIYNLTTQSKSPGMEKEGSLRKSYTEGLVVNVLRWVYIVECWRTGVLDSVSLTMKLTRLMCVFLTETDLFLNANVHGYLLSLLKLYCRPVHLDRTNLEEKIPGMASFYDFYLLLLNQYEAVSFGDPLFAGYVLLPLRQKHEVKYRKLLWGEQVSVLQALTLPLNQMIIPIASFLAPEECDLGLLRLYIQALLSGVISVQRNPLPYLIAVHHVNRFLYTQDGKHGKLKRAFIQQSICCKNKVLRSNLFYYKLFNLAQQYGMEMYSELPTSRKELLESMGITPNHFDRSNF